jgi:RNA polymerase sigma-70 factor, ECF subfamily
MNDHEQFQRSFADTFEELQLFVLRRAPNVDCEAVVSDAFVVAWTKWPTRPKRAEEIRPWLFGITRNTMRNAARRETQRPERESHLAIKESRGIECGNASELSVLTFLAQLRARDREILELVAWEQLTTRDLAIALDISETAARVRLHRARRKLESLISSNNRKATQPFAFN